MVKNNWLYLNFECYIVFIFECSILFVFIEFCWNVIFWLVRNMEWVRGLICKGIDCDKDLLFLCEF